MGEKEGGSLKTRRKDQVREKSPEDVYERAPTSVERALEAGWKKGPLPADFLPPPEELELRVRKRPTTIRIDEDVLEWFKSFGKGYQTKINAVLRAYKAAQGK